MKKVSSSKDAKSMTINIGISEADRKKIADGLSNF